MEKIVKTEEEWKARLSEEEYSIAREAGTERPFTGVYWDTETEGVYNCKCCDVPLFDSGTKFDAGCGWPSFFEPIDEEVVRTREDLTLGMRRLEVLCNRCDAHLGHVFPDGPEPTGLRFCMNSAAWNLEELK